MDFRYLEGTTEYDITFFEQKNDLSVVGYEDADYADRKSSTSYMFTLAGRAGNLTHDTQT
jgi:hypothetical protein